MKGGGVTRSSSSRNPRGYSGGGGRDTGLGFKTFNSPEQRNAFINSDSLSSSERSKFLNAELSTFTRLNSTYLDSYEGVRQAEDVLRQTEKNVLMARQYKDRGKRGAEVWNTANEQLKKAQKEVSVAQAQLKKFEGSKEGKIFQRLLDSGWKVDYSEWNNTASGPTKVKSGEIYEKIHKRVFGF